ncbi:dTMP kinase [Desulfitobacterium sp.]|uniref:dTMP kinase n=1 Tax=Desulfitobacterium sp. TaxID=49981 RepID=UPI002B20C7F7|nr:deoxynucleoside kinase [Desulfitobacterium sp.]MEA4901173.1 deoxynucleoside kinase [Desulfitobacterium sp.]
MGKLIIIEGGDGSGKATQTKKLWERLTQEGFLTMKVEFPNYDSPSSSLVKMYLGGEFGKDPNAVNPYAASTFYAVDRYASYKTLWGDFYDAGGIVLADRYVTSNMIHQAVKLKDEQEWEHYLDWLKEFEYRQIGLPEPDLILYLNMPPEYSVGFIANRVGKSSVSSRDIHEKDLEFLKQSYENAQRIRIREDWVNIPCVADQGKLKTIEEIHEEIYQVVIRHIS